MTHPRRRVLVRTLMAPVLAVVLVAAVGCASIPNPDAVPETTSTSTVAVTPDSSPTSTPADSSPATTAVGSGAATSTSSTVPAPTVPSGPWAIDTSRCADPAAANAAITSPVVIGMVAPQSGGLISAIDAPIVVGFEAAVAKANADHALGDVQLKVVVADDSGDPAITPVAVNGLLAADAQVVSGIIGTANNLAARSIVAKACIPQLMGLSTSPQLADVTNAPWTMAGLVPLTVEATVYAADIARNIGVNATVATMVSGDDDGKAYLAAFVAAIANTKVTVVAQQSVDPTVIDPATQQVLTIASRRPNAIVAALSGPSCATFLTELSKAMTAAPTWKPKVYMASSCSDVSVLSLAGPAADGVLTTSNLTTDNAAFTAAMTKAGVTNGLGIAAQGWTAAEVTVAAMQAAAKSPSGLTRASIMTAARHLSYTPSLGRPGVKFTTNGSLDPNVAESLQIVRFDAATQSFTDVGPLITQFES